MPRGFSFYIFCFHKSYFTTCRDGHWPSENIYHFTVDAQCASLQCELTDQIKIVNRNVKAADLSAAFTMNTPFYKILFSIISFKKYIHDHICCYRQSMALAEYKLPQHTRIVRCYLAVLKNVSALQLKVIQ